jgi:hypothetical protein
MQTAYILEPLILDMQDVFMEYSDLFQNDLPLNVINDVYVSFDKIIVKSHLDNILHNQEEKLKLYNYLFYKLFISQKYKNDYQRRIIEIKNTLRMIIWFDSLFESMSICHYEEYASNRSITPKAKKQKIKSFIDPPSKKITSFKLFGYSTKNNFKIRIYALNQAINYYGIDNVMHTLKKIQYFNSCFRDDYDYILQRKHLFQSDYTSKIIKKEQNDYDNTCYEIVEGKSPQEIKKENKGPFIGFICDNTYDVISCQSSCYFRNYNSKEKENEKTKNKIKKIYSRLLDTIGY